MNVKRVIFYIVLVFCFAGVFAAGAWVGVNKLVYYVPQPEGIDFSLFWDAYNELKQNFIDHSKISDQDVLYGAIGGMTKSLGDPYTDFFDPEQAKRFQQDLSGRFDGIGIEIGIKEDFLTVVAPLKGTPAEKAGLKAGDIIVKIDAVDTSDMTTVEAVDLIRGQKGTTVTLNIYRDGWAASKDVIITRDTIIVPSMEWSLKGSPGGASVAYIHIFQFDENLSSDFRRTVLEIINSPATAIVLDLRDNPGGYLAVSQDIAGWFLQKGQTVTIEDYGSGRQQEVYKAEGSSALLGYPTVILINEGTASASEILAGALRDNRNVQLIGAKSFGKGSVQEVVDLRGGSFLKVTIARWLTPKGSSISEVGLTPDIKIAITDQDAEQNIDPQLDKALEIAGSLK